MKDKRYTDKIINAFLLKELPEAESEAIEAKFFSDAEYFERICAVENQLVDSYIHGRLSRKAHELFERNYLISPARRQKVAFAKSLARATSQVQTAEVREAKESREQPLSWWQAFQMSLRSPSWVPQLAMAMAVILFIGSVWAVLKINTLRRELIAVNRERNSFEQRRQEFNRQIQDLERKVAEGNTQSEKLAKELENLRQQREELEKQQQQLKLPALQPPSIASFFLLPGSVRGGTAGAKTLAIAHGTGTVLLQVQIGTNDYSTYQAQVRTIDGTQVFSQRGLKARSVKNGTTISISIPAKKLPRNDYILTLFGVSLPDAVEEVERYFFRVKNN